MAKKRERTEPGEKTAALLKKLIIVQLGLAGIGQAQIREIVGGDIGEINGIAKLLRKKTRGGKANA
jgi:hypothetical protein